jgi:hypothetical protein
MKSSGHAPQTSVIKLAFLSVELAQPNSKAAWILSEPKVCVQNDTIQTVVRAAQ